MIARLSIYEIDEKIKTTKLYFEEDCSGFVGSNFKKGKEITLSDLKSLFRLGYHIIWVNDGKEEKVNDKSMKKIDEYLYEKKNEIEAVIGRGTFIIDESQVKRPESTLKIFDGDDLLKQNINPLQNDGAKMILKDLYGDKGRKLTPLKTILGKISTDNIEKVGFFDNISVGNSHLKKKDKKEEEKEIERTNFYLKTSINSGIAFLLTLGKILKTRNPKYEGMSQSKIDSRKRPPYKMENLINYAFSSSFADMGFLHIILDANIKKVTKILFKENGELINGGVSPDLNETSINILDRHSNVIAHILASDRSDPPLISESEAEMLKYAHRGLNGCGYPRRSMVTESVIKVINEASNETKLEMKSLFDSELRELPRLLGVINTFIELLVGTPWRLPVERDMLVRYFKMNSCYPFTPDVTVDATGEWDFALRERYEKRFDGFLVDAFLSSIYLYKCGESVPLYDILNPTEVKYHAIVIGYTDKPNRPIVKIDELNKEVNLSEEEYEKLFIGEYAPAIKLRTILEHYAPKQIENGIYLPEDLYVPEEAKSTKDEESIKEARKSRELDQKVESLFSDDAPDIDDLKESASTEDVDAFLAQFIQQNTTIVEEKSNGNNKKETNEPKEIMNGLFDDDDYIEDEEIMENLNYIYKTSELGMKECYGLGIIKNTGNGVREVTLTHLTVVVKRSISGNKYKFVKLHPAFREKITVYDNPNAPNVPADYVQYTIGTMANKDNLKNSPFIVQADTFKEGDFLYLYYVAELDPKKNPNYKSVNPNTVKGVLTYAVKVVSKTDVPDKPIVKFYSLNKIESGKSNWVKDSHYGQDIDLRKFPFFRIDNFISAKELASMLEL